MSPFPPPALDAASAYHAAHHAAHHSADHTSDHPAQPSAPETAPGSLFLLCQQVLQQLTPANCQAVCRALMPHADLPSMQSRLGVAAGLQAAEQAAARASEPGGENDLAKTLRRLGDRAMPWLQQGRLRELARHFDALPQAALQARPRLQAIALWASCLTAGPVAAMNRLAQSRLQASSDPVVRGLVEALHPMLLMLLDRHEEAYACGSPLLHRLAGTPCTAGSFADATLVNVMANAAIALGRHPEARRLLDVGRRAQSRAPSAFGLMHAESTDGIIDLLEGRLRQAAARFEVALQPPRGPAPAATRPAGLPPRHGNAWAGLLQAATVYETGHLAEAGRLLLRHLPPVCDAGLLDHMILGHVMQARIAMSGPEPDAGEAAQVLARLEAQGHHGSHPRVVASARLERARMAMLQGDVAGADAELRRADEAVRWERLAPQSHLANDLESLPLSRLRWALWLGDRQAAIQLLPQIRQQASAAAAAERHRRVLLLRLLEAMASFKTGDIGRALTLCSGVLDVCAREGYVRLVVDEGPLAGSLLQRFVAEGLGHRPPAPRLMAHARQVLQAFGRLADGLPPLRAGGPAEPPCLTAQERRMLEGVAEGLGNDALAARHGVSRNTVRTHLRHVSVKLGTHNRTEAVSVARRHGWLD